MWSINWKHFIIKLHYFFLYGGLVCSHVLLGNAIFMFRMSFVSFRIIFLISRFSICISKSALGFITDKHGNIRNIFMILLIVTTLLLFSLAYIPPIEKRAVQSTELTVTCNKRRDEMVLNLSTYEFDSSCDKEMAMEEYPCELLSHCFNDAVLSGNFKLTNNLTNNFGTTAVFTNFRGKVISNEDCDCLGKNMSKISCSYYFSECNSFTRITPEYEMYNFWIFVFLYIIAVASTQALFFLVDAACIEILDRNSSDFGKQRLWGSIGFLIAYFLAGYHNSYSLSESKTRYFIGICVMLGFFLKSMFLLCLCPITKAQSPIHACKNLKNIFFSLKNAIFLSGIFICGVFSGLMWFCEDMISWDLYLVDEYNRNSFNNLKFTIRHLVEVLFFFFSGWFVKKLGQFSCLIAALVTIALKMGLWSLVNNPWLTLLIELLEGVIYAVFSSAMILYAVDCALAGTEATTLGIFEGIYDGLGLGTAIFLSIYLLDAKSVRRTAFVSSMAILGIVPILTIFYILISRRKAKKEKTECLFQLSQMPDTIPIIS